MIAPEIVPLLVKGNQLGIVCMGRGSVEGQIVKNPEHGEGSKAGYRWDGFADIATVEEV